MPVSTLLLQHPFLVFHGLPSLCLLGGTTYVSQVPATHEFQALICPLILPAS